MSGSGLDDTRRTGLEGRLSLPSSTPAPADTLVGIGAARIATLRKVFDTVKAPAPEIAIGPIQDIASELELAALAASGHTAAWQRRTDAIPESDGTPASQAARAKAINDLLVIVEPDIARDTAMLKRVGGDSTVLDTNAAVRSAIAAEMSPANPGASFAT